MNIEEDIDENRNAEDGIFSHNLKWKEIKENKHNFNDLTSIRINFEPEELMINAGINTKLNNENKMINDLFKNHVINIFLINRGSL